jgi:hypothetical protein
MALKKYLIVEKGNVKAMTASGVNHRTYYSKGNVVPAVRADWEDYEKGTVCIQLQNGKVLIINSSGTIIREMNY